MAAIQLEIPQIDTRRDDFQPALRNLRERLSPRGNVVSRQGRRRTIEVFGQPLTPLQVVEKICTQVRDEGLPAVLDYCRRLDNDELTRQTIRVSSDELRTAHQQADEEYLATVRRVRKNILHFQQAILHRDVEVPRPHGALLRHRYRPLERVGLCIPGGAAAYPSTVLMTVVCAQAAGVPEVAVTVPPTPFGAYNGDLLATCHELGIREVYRMGGAQAVAALAYGVDGVAKVDKIAGPGNLFVALAKKFVFGQVDIDSIAGPSEVVILADDSARPEFAAADLLAQAEHSPGASILVTWSEQLLDATLAELNRQVAQLSRSDLTVESLEQFGALVRVRDAEEACCVADSIAPEHLHIAADNAEALSERIPHAGAVFLGNYSPVALGDYVAGPSHVLPTGGTARFASGLSANDFLRSNSVIQFSEQAMQKAAEDVQILADKEGLSAHRASIDIRLKQQP